MMGKQAFSLAVGGVFASIALLGAPTGLAAQGLMVTGYADFEATMTNPDGDGNSDIFFDNHHFNLIMVGDITKDLFAAIEVEYEHAGEEIALEYGYFGYTGITDLRIIAGKFIVPFGRFNKDLHPTIINKMPDRPLGFAEILPQTYNDVGVWLSGTRALGGNGTRFVYDAFVINGLLGDDGAGIRSMRGNDREKRTGDRDDNKAVGARLGLEFAPQGFDIGASIYQGNYSADAAVHLDLTLIGVDAAYRNSGFELRGELVHANQEATVDDLQKTGGYIQAAYLSSAQVEPVVRFSTRNFRGGPFDGDDANDVSRFSVGLNYYIGSSSSLRAAYHFNIEKDTFESDNNALILQWNVIL